MQPFMNKGPRVFPVLLLAAVFAGSCTAVHCALAAPNAEDTNLYAQYSSAFAEELQQLAVECEQAGEEDLAKRIRNWLPQRALDKIYLFHPGPPATAVGGESQLADKFQQLCQQHGEDLLELARQFAARKRATESIMILYESLYHAPNLAAARQLLDYQKDGNHWLTPERKQRKEAGEIWSEEFGWLPADHLPRYQKGERYYRGRWIRADKDAQLHKEIRQGWKIETEHYEVTTNHSPQAGVRVALQLEQLYSAWWQMFAAYHLSAQDLKKMFSQGTPPQRSSGRHKVVYFRDRSDYNATLGQLQPGIEGTLGFYFENQNTAYFFAAAEGNPEEKELERITLWHEATHQLFSEMIPARKVSRLKNNFWITEGIACFMESLQPAAAYTTLGGLQEGRLPAARHRFEQDQFYVPFERLVAYSAADLQRDPRIRTLYSQAAGQAAFLMLADEGRYRQAVTAYLRAVYRGSARPETLARESGVSLTKLDSEYREFLSAGDAAEDDR